MVDLHVSERVLDHALFHGTGMRDDAALHELAVLLRSFIEDGVVARSFTVDDPAFASEFLLHGLHGVLIAFVHHPRGASRDSCRHVLRPRDACRRGLTPTLLRLTKGWGQKTGRAKPRRGEGGAGRSWCWTGTDLVVVAVVAAIVLPGDDDVTHPDDWDPRVLDLVHFVEDERGLLYEHPVTIDFLTAEEYTARILERDELTDEDVEDSRAGRSRAASHGARHGRRRPGGGACAPCEMKALSRDYDQDEDRIIIRGTEISPALSVTLVHELTHALQDQHFDLDREG